ncbi:hypothetical protein [Marinimicrobium sp. ABcell2]|uniref:hypothetical protein n=1 Tax=Marinimicrobium sp. ABcell2 TaxID=3069751 RepID=UPI0027B2A721|nr:hypothetical protein [Marinimicrobium sp. ABcell2]MDQ2076386.1 hypothetical protein [Marinimicrobium sp. ABcell2]
MKRIKSIITKALLVAVPYTLIISSISTAFSSRLITFDSEGNPAGVVTGWEAMSRLIAEHGLYELFAYHGSNFLLYFLIILVALLLQGFIYDRKRGS